MPQPVLEQVLGDRYLLTDQLGRGGTAVVYRATDVVLGRSVALKVYGAVDPLSDLPRRQQEARMLAGLRHPAIVTLYDARLDADPPYLVMEHVEGESLAERLSRGRLPDAELRPVAAAAAAGLAAAHAAGIVHRDIKPANILIPTHPDPAEARLVDFGIAYSIDGARHTAVGSVVGSATYLSPEQARGAEVTAASDVYSLGLVMIESLTGRAAFPGGGVEAVAARLNRLPALDDPALDPHRPLLERMTALDPVGRPDAGEVATALGAPAATRVLALAADDQATELLSPQLSSPQSATIATGPRPRLSLPAGSVRMGLIAAAGLALVALGLALGFGLGSPAQPAAPAEAIAGHPAFEKGPGPVEPGETPEDDAPGNSGNNGNGNGDDKGKKP